MMEGFVLKSVSGVSWLVPETMVRTGLVRAGFTTRLGGVSPAPRDSLDLGLRRGDDITLARENFHRLTAAAEISGELAILSQVHSGRVVSVTAEFPPGGISLSRPVEADGMIADAPGRVLMTHHADCTPVFLLDVRRRVIALVHAGWRGCAAGIAGHAVEKMRADYDCRPEDMLAAVGPCICQDCFACDSDVPEAMRAHMGAAADAAILRRGSKWYVDLAMLSAHQLRMAGLSEKNIARTEYCTCCREDLFFSHRRMGPDRGTMLAFLELI
ncbi:MAG: peptidoglycan editing factor PgeF [Clostridia bacterium]|nr:peptidoglycan editing factor PgeF [Clostridia bacterium]